MSCFSFAKTLNIMITGQELIYFPMPFMMFLSCNEKAELFSEKEKIESRTIVRPNGAEIALKPLCENVCSK
jgi:hypothetical protein